MTGKRTWMQMMAALLAAVLLLAPAAMASSIYTGEEGVAGISDMLSGWFEDDNSAASAAQGSGLTSVADVERIYSFTLEGRTYTFPCPMADFLNNGWHYAGWAADAGASLDAMTYSSAILTNDAGKRLSVDIMNPTQSAVAVADARLMSITVRANDTPPAFATANGLSLGMAGSDVAGLYGAGYREMGMSDGGVTYKYSLYQLLNDSANSIGEPLTQQSGEDELSVIADANGAITSIYMMHAKF